jgi:hypothetical protein
LRRFLVFLGLVMANDASCGRSHQTVVARDVSGRTADDRTGSVAIAIASASAVQPRIAFMKKLRAMSFQSMCRALVPGRPEFMDPRLRQQLRQLGDEATPGWIAVVET